MGLNKNIFDQISGDGFDPLKSYIITITIPSVYIVVTFKEGKYKGYVLYTSSQKQVIYKYKIDWKIKGIKYISEELFEK